MRAANYVAGDEVVRTSRRERSIQREREENKRMRGREKERACMCVRMHLYLSALLRCQFMHNLLFVILAILNCIIEFII